MIKAEKLDYKAVTHALVSGNFYASQGPQIHSLWIEDNKIHIECSGVVSIRFNTGARHAASFTAKDGKLIESAEFEVRPEDIYVRATITDSSGKVANTIAYFTDELLG